MTDENKLSESELDFALLQLGNTSISYPLGIDEIFSGTQKKHISDFEKIMILEKLCSEGFCRRRYPQAFDEKSKTYRYKINIPAYYITYDGWKLLTDKTVQSQNPYSQYQKSLRIKNTKRDIVKIVPIATAIIAILITGWMSCQTNKSYNIGQRNYELQNRAYVRLHSMEMKWYSVGGKIAVNVSTKNGGLTPATAMSMTMIIEITDTTYVQEPNFPMPKAGDDSAYFLPNEIAPATGYTEITLTSKDDSLLKAGDKRLYAYGTIRYKDILSKTRYSYFIRVYNFYNRQFVDLEPRVTTSEDQTR